MQEFKLSVAPSAASLNWRPKSYTWEQLVNNFSSAVVTKETYREFMAMPKADQTRTKDTGAFVGGELNGSQRNKKSLVNRTVLTLDVDFGSMTFGDDFHKATDFAFFIHGTHKHSETTPRFRIVAPLSRPCTPEEYEAVARKIADLTNMDMYDPSTFQPERCMFYPSVPCDSKYYFQNYEGAPVDVDAYLGLYADWKDTSTWKYHHKESATINKDIKTQADPKTKNGIVGSFCRSYNIHEAISTFLSDVYVAAEIEGRYTYIKGSTEGGLLTFDDTFSYSYHGTDPTCTGHVYNSYDLVRVHKFGHLDKTADSRESAIAMNEWCTSDEKVIADVADQRQKFSSDIMASFDTVAETKEGNSKLPWVLDSKGNFKPVAANFRIAFKADKNLSNLIARDNFKNRIILKREPVWRKFEGGSTDLADVDLAAIRTYIETTYGISNTSKVEDAIELEASDNSFHPVRDYLNGLKWDGKKRLDTCLVDLMGAEDNAYTREAFRIMLIAACKRVFEPAAKFDTALVLFSQQGAGKSTLIRRLGREWFSDSLNTMEGKAAFEQLQGKLIIEIAELSAMRKSDVESVKNFISKTEDSYRPAFGRMTVNYPRQCVFFGTTNKFDFLVDSSGNRRFMPVTVRKNENTYKLFDDEYMNDYVDQLWAEAKVMYDAGYSTLLSDEAEALANLARDDHFEEDERAGVITKFLKRKLPFGWDDLTLEDKLNYPCTDFEEGEQREQVCIMEIAVEALGFKRNEVNNRIANEIKAVLNRLKDWERVGGDEYQYTEVYGKQRFYRYIG